MGVCMMMVLKIPTFKFEILTTGNGIWHSGYHWVRLQTTEGRSQIKETCCPSEWLLSSDHSNVKVKIMWLLLNLNVTSPKNTQSFSFTTLLQVDAEEGEGTSFIFMSDDAMTKDKLMILIHGSGVVRAGQWARRYSIPTNLKQDLF